MQSFFGDELRNCVHKSMCLCLRTFAAVASQELYDHAT